MCHVICGSVLGTLILKKECDEASSLSLSRAYKEKASLVNGFRFNLQSAIGIAVTIEVALYLDHELQLFYSACNLLPPKQQRNNREFGEMERLHDQDSRHW